MENETPGSMVQPVTDTFQENDQKEHASFELPRSLQIEISAIARNADRDADAEITLEQVNFYYGKKQALFDISFPIRKQQVTALIGPSGCGKTTLLRTLNRMHDTVRGAYVEGQALFQDQNLYDPGFDVVRLRQKIGMIFQRPNPFPTSIFENIAYGLRVQNKPSRFIKERVEHSLRQAALWDEVKDRLQRSAQGLSGGQQQRLCIARALAAEPEVILMDEPCSALDPIATLKIEETITQLQQQYTVIIVTHNMQQAARVSQFTGFFLAGKLIEYGSTEDIFLHPQQKETEDYISGRFG